MSRIELQSFDLFRRIEQIHRQPTAAPDNLQAKYILLHKVLEQACYELTTGVTLSFANLFSRLDYICKEKKMTPSDRYAIQTMRRNCNAAMGDRFQADMQEYLYDLRALVRFVSLGFEEDIPASILPEIPHSNRPYQGTRLSHIPYVRASVTSWNDTQIFAATDSDTDPFIIINYAKGGYQGDLLYLKDLLTENLPLNLLDVRVDEENHYIPNLIIIHPDYLIDISSLAACFREYGHHPLNYFMNKIKPKAYTAPILMGNLASQFLDDYINEQPQEPVTYPRTIQKFFAASALDFCTCQIPADFHAQAQAQMMNIRSFVHDVLPRNIRHFNKKNTLLEASFICEKLGLQGRVDMMQKDFQVLIEQKAGKRDEYNHRHKEDHFIQMMLYQGVLRYNFGQETEHMQTFLLYSKYADGLLLEHFAENLFRESIKLRNYIVHNEMQLGEGAIGEVVDSLSTDLLNELQVTGKLWNDYQEPQLQTAINTLKRCTPLELAYFNRFFTFVAKEQILSKTGGNRDASHGFAGNWHIPLHEKLEAGNILLGLTILQKQSSGPGKGYDLIELHIPTQEEDFLPNFRTGDMVILYSYRGEPDLRKHILMKGNILELRPDRMTLVLRNGQQNKDIIGGGDDLFAIEHDFSDTSAYNGFRGLYAFLSARADRKELLLGVRTPELKEEEVTLNGEYGRFNELIRKEKQAKDYFLLVGPPGTGKTSCALRYMVEEALSELDTSILLLSYTNRAVDEICGMLLDSGIAEKTPFIRIGSELSCDKRFVPYLLKHSLTDCPKLTDIRQKIDRTRIFVSTTTSLSSRLNLFTLKHFQLALIDEASQILEPDLIGILSARHQPHNAIDKFVLVGDYKQLPAIAQQSAEEAAVTDPILRQIGLEDCRNSLFERLYKSSPDTCRSVLRQQGRMHPAIAEFPNQTFYYREQLECVPLPHQLEETPYAAGMTAQDPIDHLLLERRMVFIPAEVPESLSGSDKTNPHEARIVSTLLAHIYRLTESHFDPNRTVGVIVPYRNQIAMIRKEIARLQLPALLDISIDTVERYQGSQRDVIIYSFTVQNFSQLNFLTANTFQEGTFLIDRKLNVALTRARKQLLLTGNPHILGANITFYKLLEYIHLHNGYLETDAESFCQGNFTLPAYRRNWELEEGSYSLPAHFQQAFEQLVPPPQDWEANEAHYREVTGYGRCNFRALPEEMTPQAFCQAYNFFYLRKQYAAAQALFTGSGNWLYDLIRKVSGRVVFCDLSCEAGASGLAFADVCRSLPHLDLTYVDIYPLQEMGEIAEAFLQTSAYKHIQTSSYPRLSAIKPTFWQAHSVLTELVIFNLSSLFDRISPQEARDLALQINQLVHARPLNHYVLVYRDDAGPCRNNHSYTAFCNHLSPELKPLQPQMPLCGKIHCNPTEGLPLSQEFLYEIRTN